MLESVNLATLYLFNNPTDDWQVLLDEVVMVRNTIVDDILQVFGQ